ncbi:hypothetical protein AVEN_35260-1 [Araneus ventricosus]|uniref:Uncharacterized protein n=1 Tax=Araneus ventricosus TaxID=182803 RepID=A0A4Y2EHP3_ARAVE|nr:hypothetical protein AVEN_35260-1 [Araneus ventricosus]
MRINVSGVRTYAQSSHCPDTELSPNHIFDCPAILRAGQGVCFSPEESDEIVQIAKTALYTHGFTSLTRWTRHHRHNKGECDWVFGALLGRSLDREL